MNQGMNDYNANFSLRPQLSNSAFALLSPEAKAATRVVLETGDAKVRVFNLGIPEDAHDYCRIINGVIQGHYRLRYENSTWTREDQYLVCVSWIELDLNNERT